MKAERFFTDSPSSPVQALAVGTAGAVHGRCTPSLLHIIQASATHDRQRARNLSPKNPNAEGTEQ